MSHFTVLVVTNTASEVEPALQPFHEYECTGTHDEYVIWVDCHNDVCYKWNNTPELHEQYKTFNEFTETYYGYKKNSDGRYGHFTNPNAKWDWWKIGGRWAGFFQLKPGTVGIKGEPGLMNSQRTENGVDQARKKDIDFAAMMQDAATAAEQRFDGAARIINGRTWTSWKATREALAPDIDTARRRYNGQKVVTDLDAWNETIHELDFFFDPDQFLCTRDKYIHKAKCNSISTFAILKDGEWLERGEMGWFGCTGNEKETWEDDFIAVLNTIPDDALLTIVDCHI